MKHRGEYILLGGTNQWISYDASNLDKPLILFLHGGPGWVITPLLQHYCRPVFEKYLVINWDQRGSGKSYTLWQNNPLSVDQLVRDGIELSRLVCKKFKKDKIILVGHSWGSVLGVLMCKSEPRLFYKYIGIGQIGNWLKGEGISYDFVLQKATHHKKTSLIKKLEHIGRPPYKKIAHLVLQRKWLLKFGGSLYGKANYLRRICCYLQSRDYSLFELLKIGMGLKYSLFKLWDECLEIDLTLMAGSLDLPVYFISGKYDLLAPVLTSKEYFDCLESPHKKWYWFEHSAHAPMLEEPEKFNALMLNEILPVSNHPVNSLRIGSHFF